jgi:hypothetical protein
MIRQTLLGMSILIGSAAMAQQSNNPFTNPIEAQNDIIVVNFEEFATLPAINGEQARMMQLVAEPGNNRRLWVNDQRGQIYIVTYDGGEVTQYIDVDDYGVQVSDENREQGMQSFALHPDFNRSGAPGYGKFYTWTDSINTRPQPDYVPRDTSLDDHDIVLHGSDL